MGVEVDGHLATDHLDAFDVDGLQRPARLGSPRLGPIGTAAMRSMASKPADTSPKTRVGGRQGGVLDHHEELAAAGVG